MLKCSSLYTFSFAVLLMCLQTEGSGIEMLNFVMQVNARVGFKNICVKFLRKEKYLGCESWSASLNILLGLF